MEVHFETSQNPLINYASDGLLVDVRVNIKWFAVKNGQFNPIFTTNCIVKLKAIIRMNGLNVVPSFIYLSQDNTLIETQIGQFDVKVIDRFMNIAYERG
jgi:hypothetical protein